MDKKVKILYTSEFGSLTGGGQQSLLLLMHYLDKDLYQPALISREDGVLVQEAKRRCLSAEVMVPCRLRSMNVLGIQRSFKELERLVKRQKIDIIHTDSPRWTYYLGRIARQMKIPLVYHARVGESGPWIYERATYNLSSRIIAVSESVKKRFEKFPGADRKISVIYNAVDTEKFGYQCDGSRLRNELGLRDDLLIGIVGQLTSNKGQEEFLRAAAKAVQDMPNVKFVIIGKETDGYLSKMNKLIGELSLNDFVIYFSSRSDMPATMAAMDILVNASHMEGFSRVVIEAMASGKPVIATEVGGNSEAVINDGTGLLVPPGDPDRLAQAMLKLGGDGALRQRLGLTGRARAEEMFSVNTQIGKVEALYQQLIT